MGTKEALSKLNDKQIKTLKTLSAVLNDSKAKGNAFYTEEYKNKIRGYLECLVDAEVISRFDQRFLFAWFYDDHRE